MTIYIPTLGRMNNLKAIMPRWLESEIPIRIVVREDQYKDHMNLCREMGWRILDVDVVRLPRGTFGYGATRNFIVRHARKMGDKSIIISDDDMRPRSGTDMGLLLDEADKPRVLGVGAVRSLHDRFTGGAISRQSGVILCPGGWGFQTFAVNVGLVLAVGNFDPLLHTHGDDGELARNGIAHGIPWLVHTDVWVEPIGVRYAAGGISSLYPDREARAKAERENMAIIYERWPKYANHPDKRFRMAWQKMLTDYIPDWRERSALHGGKL